VTSIDISPDGSQVLVQKNRQKFTGGDRFILYMRVFEREKRRWRETKRERESLSLSFLFRFRSAGGNIQLSKFSTEPV